jgi:subtilisin
LNESALLKMLYDDMNSSGGTLKRHIVHFKNHNEYVRFIRTFQREKPSFPIPDAVQPIPLIRAITCTLHSCKPIANHPSIRFVEEDVRIRMLTSHIRLTPQPQTVSLREVPYVPWGVRQIRAPEAWKWSRGNRVKIGVIDTGIDYMHPDLRGRISKGVNLIHRSLLPVDDNGHGTHISGIIAASNFTSGIIGVAPQAMIHPVKAFDRNGTAYVSDIVLGIDWCVRNRMDVINMSFGMRTRSQSFHDAVRHAYAEGIVIVASSGNEGRRSGIDYPARFTQTIAVGATTKNGKLARFSNRGKAIDIYAPGDKIRSTWLNRSYAELSGTSMATSHVTGVIALMLQLKPDLRPSEIKSLLKKTANPISVSKSAGSAGAGEIDALRAVRGLK